MAVVLREGASADANSIVCWSATDRPPARACVPNRAPRLSKRRPARACIAAQSTRLTNRLRDALLHVHPALERLLGKHIDRPGVVSLLAADHDPAQFPDPGRLDPDRAGPRHVAFGHGPHQCLGQSLARAELDVVYRTLFTRVPGLRLAVPVTDLPVKDDGFVYGLYELPVAW